MSNQVTRRDFLKTTGAAAVAATVATGATIAAASEVDWADEADVVILGTGCAGLSAACTVGLEELGTCLVLEAAPEELSGGNSKVSGQYIFCPSSVEGAIAYQTELNLPYVVEPELVRAWAEEIVENVDWLEENCGANMHDFRNNAEYPEVVCADEAFSYLHEGKNQNKAVWLMMKALADSFNTKFYYEARGIDLITNEAGEVIGVTCEDGRNFKANKGVLLACGGYEQDEELMQLYSPIGMAHTFGKGSYFNRGDGIKMAQRLGAKLWHMNSMSGNLLGIKILSKDDPHALTWPSFGYSSCKSQDFIYVDSKGDRFTNERLGYLQRHGMVFRSGTWAHIDLPTGAWCIFGQALYDAESLFKPSNYTTYTEAIKGIETNDEGLEAGIIVKCETIADIAAATGIDEAKLQKTIEVYNGYAAAGEDLEYQREKPRNAFAQRTDLPGHEDDVVKLQACELPPIEPPYYVVELCPTLLNTQGGPKRGVGGEVLNMDEKPIPRLYAAGEMGCIYAYRYNIGGNLSEAISSGRIAARSIAKLDPVA
ncbi:MAG: FAD-binding protein [Coriobacteriales bacterium]|nr:FAD-binding protein [Coriobacteriales bacterium]